jgi:hypothetical protein
VHFFYRKDVAKIREIEKSEKEKAKKMRMKDYR